MTSISLAGYPWAKTSEPVVSKRGPGDYRLRTMYTRNMGGKTERTSSGRFETPEEALAAAHEWRVGLEKGKGRSKGKPADDSAMVVPTTSSSSASATTAPIIVLPAGKSLNSLGKLDACQMRTYKRKHQEGSKMTRSEFAMSEMLSARETRLAQRGQTSKVKKKFPKFVQRCRYISTRVAELETRMGKTSEEVDRLGACMSTNLRGLLPPRDAASSPGAADATPAGGSAQSEEDGKRPKAAAPSPVSEKQLSRLMSQAHAVSLVLRGEIERDKLQVQHFKEAEVLAQTEAPLTAADLKVWVAKISAVMDKAVAVRQEFPLLGIAENVVESWRLTQKPSTLVLWTHEFRKLGGFFKRDERGL